MRGLPEILYSWNSVISIIIHRKENEKTCTYLKEFIILLCIKCNYFVSLKYQRSTMACIFALMTISYYFGKQEATSSIKENKINEIKDICIL